MAEGPYFKPPSELSFDGNVAANWKIFKREYEIFMSARHKNRQKKSHVSIKYYWKERSSSLRK